MDPITLAARRFLEEIDAAFDPPPRTSAPTGAVRIVAEPSDRGDVMKALRLREWRPDNRRPMLVVEAEGARALRDTLAGEYAALRKGLEEDGIALGAYRDAPIAKDDAVWEHVREELASEAVSDERAAERVEIERARRALRSAAEQIVATELLDGLEVVLMPPRVEAPQRFRDLVAGLLRDHPDRGPLRLLVYAPAIDLGSLVPCTARFEVDREALMAFLRDLEPPAAKGPTVKELATTPEQKKALEDKLGQRVASQDAARTLRSLVLEAGEALSAGRHAVAAKKLRAARTLCRLSGLTREEATMLVMVGAAHMNAGDEKRALAAYGEAKAMGEEHGYTDTVVQALFGIAGVHVAARRFGEAEKHYAEVEAVATEELAPLRLEALRMRGICLERLGDRAGAIVRYESALALAEDLGPLPASHTGYRDAGERLIAAHAASGKMSLVAATKARLEALALSPDERPRKLEERAS